jgi:hypothetical protein
MARFHAGLVRNPLTKYQNAELSICQQVESLEKLIPLVVASALKAATAQEEEKKKRETLTELGMYLLLREKFSSISVVLVSFFFINVRVFL